MIAIAIAVFFLGNLAFFLSYRPYEIDNTWFASFSYGFSHGVPSDEFMSMRFPGGQDGTQLFGKIAAALQTAAGNPFGWQQFPLLILNDVLVSIALVCWAWILRRCGASKRATFTILLTLAVTEPIISAVQRFRYEAVGLTLASAGVALAAADWPFLALFAAFVAVETQPIALLGTFPVLFLVWSRRRPGESLLTALKAAAAAACAAAVYVSLHPQFLQFLGAVHSLQQSQNEPWNGGVLSYFFQARHIVEGLIFALLLSGMCWGWARSRSLPVPMGLRWLLWAAVLSLAVGAMIRHVNMAYIVYAYPMLVALLVLFRNGARWQWGVVAGACLLMLPQYTALAWINRGQGYRGGDIRKVQADLNQVAAELHKRPEDLVIIGDYSLWYAHPRNFHANTHRNDTMFAGGDVLMCFEKPFAGVSQPQMLHCSDYLRMYPGLTLLHLDTVRGNTLFFYGLHPLRPIAH